MTATAPTRPAPPGPGVDLERFTLTPAHHASAPAEARGLRRDGVRLLVSRGLEAPVHARFTDLPAFLEPGDLLVVNTSATLPAALDGRLPDGRPVVVHLSGELVGGLWLVEARRPARPASVPWQLEGPTTVDLVAGAGGRADLLAPFRASRRLWWAALHLGDGADVAAHLARHGRPIRYGYVPRDWPLGAYRSVFADEPGSAEMPSASRPFTADVVAALARRGVGLAPIVLHTGVSSLEGDEEPYPERYRVPEATAARVNETHARGGRVVAVGTTVVRALETVTDGHGTTHPGGGWTELVVGPDHPVGAVDGLVTGWHEPRASHLHLLEAVAGRRALELAYGEAIRRGYLWHEFGDSHLLLPARPTACRGR